MINAIAFALADLFKEDTTQLDLIGADMMMTDAACGDHRALTEQTTWTSSLKVTMTEIWIKYLFGLIDLPWIYPNLVGTRCNSVDEADRQHPIEK